MKMEEKADVQDDGPCPHGMWLTCDSCFGEVIQRKNAEIASLTESLALVTKVVTDFLDAEEANGDDCESPRCGHNYACPPCLRAGSFYRCFEKALISVQAKKS